MKFLKLSLMELKKIFKAKGVYIGILIAVMFAVAIGIQAKISPASFNSNHVFSFFSSIANLVLIVYGAKSLADEFQIKTSTQLFTSKQSRATILLVKVMSIVLLSVILSVIGAILLITFKYILSEPLTIKIALKDLWVELYTFVIYGFVVSAFGSFVTMFTLNTATSIISTIAAFFIGPNIIAMIMDRYPDLVKILEIIPFYSADCLTSYHNVGILGVLVLILFGFIMFLTNTILMSKQDLR